jgi:hypothetical protein
MNCHVCVQLGREGAAAVVSTNAARQVARSLRTIAANVEEESRRH